MASVGDFLFSLYKPIMSVGNFLSGGALSRIEERQHAQLLAQQQLTATKLQEQLAKQARDQTYNQSLRQAAIDSTQLDIAAEKATAAAREGAVSIFKAESQGNAQAAATGLAMGSSNYAALDSSVTEAMRNLRQVNSENAATLGLDVLQAQTTQENARFTVRQDDAKLSLLAMDESNAAYNLEQAKNDNSVFNNMLDLTGGFLKTVSSIYSVGAKIDQVGTMLGGFENIDLSKLSQISMEDLWKIGGAIGSGDASKVGSLMTPFMKDNLGLGGFTLQSLGSAGSYSPLASWQIFDPSTISKGFKIPSLLGSVR